MAEAGDERVHDRRLPRAVLAHDEVDVGVEVDAQLIDERARVGELDAQRVKGAEPPEQRGWQLRDARLVAQQALR